MALPRPLSKLPPIRALTCVFSASPASAMPYWPSISMPSKSSRRMKLTTPAMASAPYTAAAPPVITSTLSIAAAGIVLTSTTRKELTGCGRRPSIRTRLRFEPKPRRSSVAAPGAWEGSTNGDPAGFPTPRFPVPSGVNCGSWFNALSTLKLERFSNVSASMVTMGLLA